MGHILIVEDDPDIASLLCRGLTAAGHAALWAESLDMALPLLDGAEALILDMMLGEESGIDLLADLRARGLRLPVIVLSALARVEDRAQGLAAGANDYVVKPFQLSELIARLDVQLHRAAAAQPALLRLGDLSYDAAERQVSGAGRRVQLTEREGELLAHLIAHQGQVLTRGQIFDALWAPHGVGTENVVDVYLGYLRRKLDGLGEYGLRLRTLRGRGFQLTLSDEAA